MRLILVTTDSQGLKTDLAMVEQAIRTHLAKTIELAIVVVAQRHTVQPEAANDRTISIAGPIDAVIFFEGIVDHTGLSSARHRILIPNPEWLTPRVVASMSRLTEIWHKTQVSLTTLAASFPGLRHAYI